jgi:two-component system sensor histidine kinase PilS (NtrC family)
MIFQRRLFWFILSRLVLVVLFYLSSSFFYAKDPDLFGREAIESIRRLCLAAGAFSLLSLPFLSLPARHLRTLSSLQIVWDVLFVTVLILLTGGILSPFPFTYLLAIINTSVLHSRRESIYTASLCAILYGAILDFQYYGHLDQLGVSGPSGDLFGPVYVLYNLFINIGVFYLTAFLTGHLASRAQVSEAALLEREIDYDELSRLNNAIVQNVASALLTVTPEGRIRVFNPAAEKLVGTPLGRVYNAPLAEVLPNLVHKAANLAESCEGEFVHQRGDEQLVCSFRSLPFFDAAGAMQGAIFDIRDVTRLQQLEEELKKADRLAAVGSMAARMAHEIRNPLAAVSGSVQLMAENVIAEADKPLLDIVVRETDRLNQLLAEFLAYARPPRPNFSRVPLVQLIEEQRAIMAADPQFAGVQVVTELQEGLEVDVDVGLFKQVLWNLCTNAADAMDGHGVLRIRARRVGPDRRGGKGGGVLLRFSDNGAGMPEEVTGRIFEPFFTTKVQGTGLGMATVYRIVEAHGGTISVSSTPGRGTTFELFLSSVPALGSGGEG